MGIWFGSFNEDEFRSKDGRESPFPHVIKRELYDKLNEIRLAYGKPIIINSGYRSPEHNKKVGGVPNSYHVQGIAADIRPKFRKDLARLQSICDKLNDRGGVGFYDSFVHVDVRGTRARWDERTERDE